MRGHSTALLDKWDDNTYLPMYVFIYLFIGRTRAEMSPLETSLTPAAPQHGAEGTMAPPTRLKLIDQQLD